MNYDYCEQIDRHICFNRNYISSCTIGNNEKNQCIPVIIDNYKGEKIDWNEFFDERERIKKEAKEGKLPQSCEGCKFIENKDWDNINNSREFTYIQFSHWLKCNSDCIYCGNHTKPDKINSPDTYNSLPIVEDLIKGNHITKNTKIDFAGGEPTMYYKFNNILALLLKTDVKEILIHSNVIKYSKEIENGIKKGKVNLCVSVDAGSKKIHEKVKGVKSYDKVWKHIKKYSDAKNPLLNNYISLKYIIIPGINDTEDEIDIWIQKSLKSGVNTLLLNADNNIFIKNHSDSDRDKILERVIELTEYFSKKVKEYNINHRLEYNIRYAYIKKNRTFPNF